MHKKIREWIMKQSIYDFLCYTNEENVNHCIVTRINRKEDSRLCRTYNSCRKHPNTEECSKEKCSIDCKEFKPDCKMCIADFLNKEKR